jgi:hypothetical protein
VNGEMNSYKKRREDQMKNHIHKNLYELGVYILVERKHI